MSRMLYIVIIVVFIDTFIQLPIITPYALSLGATETLAGAIVAVYSLANMAGNVIGGHWIDRIGRRPVLVIGMVSVGVILLFYPLAQSGEQLFVIRLIHGLAGGVLIPGAFALIGDRSSTQQGGRTMAFAGASIGIAAITGPAIGGALAAQGEYSAVFLFVAGLFLVTVLVAYRYIPGQSTPGARGQVQLGDFVPLIKNLTLLQASLAAFALMISNGTLAFALPLKIGEIDFTSAMTGMLLSLYGITALVIFVTPLNRVYERVAPLKLVVAGLILIAASLGLVSFVEHIALLVTAMVIYGTGFALIFPSMNQMVANASTALDRGKAYGIFYAFFSLGVVAGSSVAGFVAEQWGVPFTFGSGLILICALVLAVLSPIKQTKGTSAAS
ncbi:MFS transporter [Salsuginibacillus kocurii]|uniref:MFS transporter n=1 Tax=Salsuginibacillus kocurii TaxID=427078 RepID=UPI00036DB50C|nr:MFS transporter [Salsuginibacillus kocurii]